MRATTPTHRLTAVCVAPGALLVVEGGTVDVGGATGVVVGVPPLTHWLYEDECDWLRSTPKKSKLLCSWKLESMSEGSSTPVSVEAT